MPSTDLESHFKFGENWQSFARGVDESRINDAIEGLSRLISPDEIFGKHFFDIGCGSGLSMLAALRMGASSVNGIDIDPKSVQAAQALLSKHAAGRSWSVEVRSVFELGRGKEQNYDIVHSWGVLHHTGDMWEAIDRATGLVAVGGTLVIAIYRKKLLCSAWRLEKRFYARSPSWIQAIIRGAYKTLFFIRLLLSGRSPWDHMRSYHDRGMSWHHDVHDWLGGFPYESAHPAQVEEFLSHRGFSLAHRGARNPYRLGIFGTACDEFVAHRTVRAG